MCDLTSIPGLRELEEKVFLQRSLGMKLLGVWRAMRDFQNQSRLYIPGQHCNSKTNLLAVASAALAAFTCVLIASHHWMFVVQVFLSQKEILMAWNSFCFTLV